MNCTDFIIEVRGEQISYDSPPSISRRLSSAGTASFTTRDLRSAGFLFLAPVIIKDQSDQVLFTGIVINASFNYSNQNIICSINCQDYFFFLRTKILRGAYSGDAQTVLMLMAENCGFPKLTSIPAEIGPINVNLIFGGEYLEEGVRALCNKLNAAFFIDSLGNLILVNLLNELPDFTKNLPNHSSPPCLGGLGASDFNYQKELSETTAVSIWGKNADGTNIEPKTIATRFDIIENSVNKLFPLIENVTIVQRVEIFPLDGGPPIPKFMFFVTPPIVTKYIGSVSVASFLVITKEMDSSLTLIGAGLTGNVFTFESNLVTEFDSTGLEALPSDGQWSEVPTEEGFFVVYGYTSGSLTEIVEYNVEDNNLDGESFSIRGTTFALKLSPAGGTDIQIGGSDSETESNALLVLANHGQSLLFSSSLSEGKIRVESLVPGLVLGATTSDNSKLSLNTVRENSGQAYVQSGAEDLTVLDNDLTGESIDVGATNYEFGVDILIGATNIDTALNISNKINENHSELLAEVIEDSNLIRVYARNSGQSVSISTSNESKISVSIYSAVSTEIAVVPCSIVTDIYHQFVSSSGSQDLIIEGYTYYANIPTEATFEFFRTCDGGEPISLGQFIFPVNFAPLGCYWQTEGCAPEGPHAPPCDGKAWRIADSFTPIQIGPFAGCCGEEIMIEFYFDHYICA